MVWHVMKNKLDNLEDFCVNIPTIGICNTNPELAVITPIISFKDDDFKHHQNWIDELKYDKVERAQKYD
jgi:ribosomal protein S2